MSARTKSRKVYHGWYGVDYLGLKLDGFHEVDPKPGSRLRAWYKWTHIAWRGDKLYRACSSYSIHDFFHGDTLEDAMDAATPEEAAKIARPKGPDALGVRCRVVFTPRE